MMRANVIRKFGGPQIIENLTISIPEIKSDQILIRNHVAGVNPVDTYIRAGQYSKLPELPYIPGKDGAGIVEKIGEDVRNIKVGDRVWYGMQMGSTAELTAVNLAFPLPKHVSFAQGACLGVPYLTAYRALFIQGQAKNVDTILVHGASGGVGSAIMQLAAWKNIKAVGTAGSDAGIDFVKSLGAHKVYNHSKDGYVEEMKRDYPNGFNLILEMAADKNLNNDMGLLAKNGKIAVIGNRGETMINARVLMQKEGMIYGTALALSSREEIYESGKDIVKFLEETNSRPIIAKEYNFDELGNAHSDIINNTGAKGNLVIRIV